MNPEPPTTTRRLPARAERTESGSGALPARKTGRGRAGSSSRISRRSGSTRPSPSRSASPRGGRRSRGPRGVGRSPARPARRRRSRAPRDAGGDRLAHASLALRPQLQGLHEDLSAPGEAIRGSTAQRRGARLQGRSALGSASRSRSTENSAPTTMCAAGSGGVEQAEWMTDKRDSSASRRISTGSVQELQEAGASEPGADARLRTGTLPTLRAPTDCGQSGEFDRRHSRQACLPAWWFQRSSPGCDPPGFPELGACERKRTPGGGSRGSFIFRGQEFGGQLVVASRGSASRGSALAGSRRVRLQLVLLEPVVESLEAHSRIAAASRLFPPSCSSVARISAFPDSSNDVPTSTVTRCRSARPRSAAPAGCRPRR